ncbi:hypothetical protein [Caproicibacterium sp. BJN0003]|uniref:phage major tropism determinant n=1 Tax=Caproicibacterium sp. BJN0003 TaxID=2994078 RepID=UPI00224FDA79|nr:hypothetical protein [Caproicibacterium sp. BJN0003]UZT82153.1 hypothetical protein OP489_11905 [Caproicibacterium sp. BJN0003]
MSRFLTDDFINKDPRALLNTSKIATLSDVVAPSKQYINATGTAELTIDADCIIAIAGGGVFKTALTRINANSLDTGSFSVGKDYYIYICDPGNNNDEIYLISLNSTYPEGYNATNSRKIGGFHYGKNRSINSALRPVNASGSEFGTGWESTVYDGIVPRSVWTLGHRPKCAPEGMVYLANNFWCDIYLSSDDGAGGLQSKFNATPMTGTEGMNWYSFNERAAKSGKRLLDYSEFCAAAFGSPQGLTDSNTNAWSASTNTGRQLTGYVANAVSSVGVRDAVGNVWKWLNELVTKAEHTVITGAGTFDASDGSRGDKNFTSGNGHGTTGKWGWDTVSPFDGYGNIFEFYDYSIVALLGGGYWNHAVNAGSRTVSAHAFPWNVNVVFGALLGCDGL